ncbi:CYP749A22 protein [Fagus crenata]
MPKENFLSLEQDSADCRRRILEAQRSTAVDSDIVSRSKHRINDDDDSSDGEGDRVAENGKAEESKTVKAKKPKKPKVTVSDVAAKIDADDLSVFLADITGQQESAVSVGEDVQGVHGGEIRRCE